MPDKPAPPTHSAPSTFASRRADRLARIEAGEEVEQTPRRSGTIRAGLDEPQPLIVVRHV